MFGYVVEHGLCAGCYDCFAHVGIVRAEQYVTVIRDRLKARQRSRRERLRRLKVQASQAVGDVVGRHASAVRSQPELQAARQVWYGPAGVRDDEPDIPAPAQGAAVEQPSHCA